MSNAALLTTAHLERATNVYVQQFLAAQVQTRRHFVNLGVAIRVSWPVAVHTGRLKTAEGFVEYAAPQFTAAKS